MKATLTARANRLSLCVLAVFFCLVLVAPAGAAARQSIAVENVVLHASSADTFPSDTLTATYDLLGGATTARTAWYRNGIPEMALFLPMEGSEPSALLDYSGNGVTVTKFGDAIWSASAGHDGSGAYRLDGTGDRLSAGENFPVGSSYTKVAWVYRTGSPADGGNNIISGDITTGGHALWAPTFYGNKLSAGHNGIWNLVQDPVALALNTWYQVAVSYDTMTDSLILYKNGVEVDRDYTTDEVTDATIAVGSFGTALCWMGTLDEVRIYDHALSPAQIATLYTTTGPDVIDPSETHVHDVWRADVTPFSGAESGPTVPSGSVTIADPNHPPVANPDIYTVDESATVNAVNDGLPPGVLDNDTDEDGDSLTAVLVSGPSHGELNLHVDGSFDYTHDGSETTGDSFTYAADDGHGGMAPAIVAIAVNPVPDPPLAIPDNYTVAENGAIHAAAGGSPPGLLDNDTDPEGDSLTANLVSGPSHAASFSLDPNGSFNYTHDGSLADTDSFVYEADDGNGGTTQATASIAIHLDPRVTNVALTASLPISLSTGDLTVTYTLIGTAATTAAAWYRNGSPEMAFYLPMEGADPGARLDYSGHGHSATPLGNPTWSASGGHDGFGAYTFDGDDMLDGGENFPIDSSYTKAAWIYRTGNGSGDGDNIISGDTVAGGHAFWAPSFNGNKLAAGHNGVWFLVQDQVALALNTWYLVAVTYDADTDSLILYKNGTEVARGYTTDDVTDATISVGSFGAGLGLYWKGRIDDARVYDHALTAGQIATLYTSGRDIIDSSETNVGEQWQSCVTPFSDSRAGPAVCSNILTIQLLDAPPAAVADTYRVALGGLLNELAPGVLGNDTDPENDLLTASLVSGTGPYHAAGFALNTDGSFAYVHDGLTADADSFVYEASDGNGGTAQATVFIAISPTDVPEGQLALRILQNHPNPFNPTTRISYSLPEAQRVELAVFTLDGRRLVTLVDEERAAGYQEATWNGKDATGRQVASGTYICRIRAGSAMQTRKMTLAK